MHLIHPVQHFFQVHGSPGAIYLLALSGGSDSMALLHCLRELKKRVHIDFHIAHVDHGWREESKNEAVSLRIMAEECGIPFHFKTLDPQTMKGNLEAECRKARYEFFNALCQENGLDGVIIAHQAEDQLETIFKKVLEGSSLIHLRGLQPVDFLDNLKIYRPLLDISKKEITQFLNEHQIHFFDDKTNRDEKFLRARMRHTILPWLNQAFGKEVGSSFLHLGQQARELGNYFGEIIPSYVSEVVSGPWGDLLDVSEIRIHPFLMKEVVRQMCEKLGFYVSRQIMDRLVTALSKGEANKLFSMGPRHLWVDRSRLFVLTKDQPYFPGSLSLSAGLNWENEGWSVKVEESSVDLATSSWKEAWQGKFQVSLPSGHYNLTSMKDNIETTNQKIPAFLKSFFPAVYRNSHLIHEFLTGKNVTITSQMNDNLTISLVR